MTNTTAMSADGFVPPSEMDFHALVAHVKSTFAKHASKLIFVTATDNTSFNSVYLDNLPEHEHDGHNCFTCRDFLKRFGGLVYVDRQGVLRSAVWDETDAPEGYGPTVKALREKAEAGKIAKRFFSEEEIRCSAGSARILPFGFGRQTEKAFSSLIENIHEILAVIP